MSEALDKWSQMFQDQQEFMELLRENDKMPEFPVELTTKPGQRLIKETMFNMIEELMEASFTLKNKVHRQTDVRVYDRGHYLEELGDALAYFLEVAILSGFTPQEVFEEYKRKHAVVVKRLQDGY